MSKAQVVNRGLNAKRWNSVKLMMLIMPFMALVFVFSYYPLYGWIYAFYDYRPPFSLQQSEFKGLYWFSFFLQNQTKRAQILNVLLNTFVMSGMGIITSWLPMMFAILLNEIRSSGYRRVVQTLTTIPNFISWILVYSMAFSLFSTSGMVNTLLENLGLINKPIMFLQQANTTWLNMWLWSQWKGLGWNAILYLAAITGIDQEMYEAAIVDGANRFHTIWYITIPGLLPTYFVLLLLSIANFLNNGMDQYFIFQNAFNTSRIQVLDLYVYNLGMGSGNYSLATAISILKSVVSLGLLFSVNGISKMLRHGESII